MSISWGVALEDAAPAILSIAPPEGGISPPPIPPALRDDTDLPTPSQIINVKEVDIAVNQFVDVDTNRITIQGSGDINWFGPGPLITKTVTFVPQSTDNGVTPGSITLEHNPPFIDLLGATTRTITNESIGIYVCDGQGNWTEEYFIDTTTTGGGGTPGPPGPPGPAGPAGPGVPTGGTAGQVLTKNSATNYDTYWNTPSGGGGGIPDAPNDGANYARKNLGWNNVDIIFAPLASPTFTGDPKAPTPATADNDTSIATTAFVKAQGYTTGGPYQPLDADLTAIAALTGIGVIYYRSAADTWTPVTIGTGLSFSSGTLANTVSTAGLAPLASPVFTGDPQAPTATAGDNDTSIATTAFVQTAVSGVHGIPSGGTTGQILTKNSATNYDVSWGASGGTGPGYLATSTTSLPIALGPQTVTTQPGLAYTIGARTRFSSRSDPTQWMEGLVTAYNSSTGSLTINVDLISSGAVVGSAWTTGDVKLTYKTVADSGWVMMNDGSIGDASSGATTRANSDCQNLFTLFYGNCADADVPIQTSTGSATTRAAQGTAATAWAAHCRLVLPKALGRAVALAGAGSGLTSRALGANAGAETHTQVAAEIASHIHTIPYSNATSGSSSFSFAGGSPGDPFGATGTRANSPAGSTMSVLNPMSYMNIMVCL